MKNKQVKRVMIAGYKEKLAKMYYCRHYQNIEIIIRFLSSKFFGFPPKIGAISLTANQLKGK